MSSFDLLDGVNVLEVAHLGPSSLGGWLADLGANVIKVETGEGDPIRRYGSSVLGGPEGFGFLHLRWNRGKRSINIDLKKHDGAQIFQRLTEHCDIVVEGMRAGMLDRLGLGYEALRQINPSIVFCSVSGFGSFGPYSRLGSHGPAYDAMGGLGADVGQATPHIGIGLYAVSLHSAVGTLAALVRALRTGQGAYIEVAASDSAAHWLPDAIDPYLNDGLVYNRPGHSDTGRQPRWPLLCRYPTKDGFEIFFQAHTERVFWENFCTAVHRPDLADYYDHVSDAGASEADGRLYRVLSQIFATRTAQEWMAEFIRSDIAGSPVHRSREVPGDPHFAARENVYSIDLGDGRMANLMGTPIKVAGQEFAPKLAPELGEQTDEILESILGFSRAEIAALRRKGVVV